MRRQPGRPHGTLHCDFKTLLRFLMFFRREPRTIYALYHSTSRWDIKKIYRYLRYSRDLGLLEINHIKEMPGPLPAKWWRLKWIDVDSKSNTITLNLPEKRGRSRIFRISNKLKEMLQALPKCDERIFGYVSLANAKHTYLRLRKRIASRLQNPRILRITFHTFRHWKATMLYHQTKDIVGVMKFLGHRDIRNTMRYIDVANHYFEYKPEEFITRVAVNVKGARALLEAGFEYVMDRDNLMIFRKRK